MKLAFSNIAWDADEDSAVRAVLRDGNFGGIEIAPTKCWPDWQGAEPAAAERIRSAMQEDGFAIPALQAVLFGKPDLKVFGDAEEQAALIAHMEQVAALAAALGAETLVFGSPRNRDPGALSAEAAIERATPVFRAIGECCARHGVRLGIEANPEQYNCRFLTRWREAAAFVRHCAHPGVWLHLDAACTYMAGDDVGEAVAACADILSHVHVSEPELGAFDNPVADHRNFAAALRRAGYERWCSVEMRRTEPALAAVETAARFAREHYG